MKLRACCTDATTPRVQFDPVVAASYCLQTKTRPRARHQARQEALDGSELQPRYARGFIRSEGQRY